MSLLFHSEWWWWSEYREYVWMFISNNNIIIIRVISWIYFICPKWCGSWKWIDFGLVFFSLSENIGTAFLLFPIYSIQFKYVVCEKNCLFAMNLNMMNVQEQKKNRDSMNILFILSLFLFIHLIVIFWPLSDRNMITFSYSLFFGCFV